MINKLILISISLLVMGCASVNVHLPMARMESSEAIGTESNRIQIMLGGSPAHNLTITPDASRRPPDLSEPSFDAGGGLMGSASYGLFKRLDLGLHTVAGPSPWMFKAKYQIIGQPRSSAKAGDFSLSVIGAIGQGSSSKNGDQDGDFGPGGHDWDSKSKYNARDISLVAGVRLSDRLLLTAGGFYIDSKNSTNITHQQSHDGLSPHAEYSVDHHLHQRGGNAGLRWEFGVAPGFLHLEYVYSDIRLGSQARDSANALAISGGAYF